MEGQLSGGWWAHFGRLTRDNMPNQNFCNKKRDDNEHDKYDDNDNDDDDNHNKNWLATTCSPTDMTKIERTALEMHIAPVSCESGYWKIEK